MKKNFYRILSILLFLTMLFLASCTSVDSKNKGGNNYYVMNGGEGDGRTKDAPAASVEEVIAIINEDIENAESEADKAFIYIIDRDDWKSAPEDGMHNMAYIGSIPNCTVDLVIQSLKKSKAHLAFKEGISGKDNSGFEIEKGYENSITFKNLVMVSTGSDSYMYLGGAKVIFADDVEFANVENWDGGRLAEDNELNIVHTERESEAAMFVNDMNIEINSPAESGKLYIPGNGHHTNVSYDGDFNIVLDNSKIGKDSPFGICLGSGGTEYFHSTIITRNLNINIKNASQVNFLSGGNPNAVFSVEGAIQMLLNPEVTYNTTDIAGLSVVPDGSEVYLLSNNIGDSDIISFTETAGTYTVKEGVEVKAYNKVTGETFVSEKGTLTLTAGSYSLDVYEKDEKNETVSVYVTDKAADGEEETEADKDETINISKVGNEKKTYKDDVNIVIDKKDAQIPVVWGVEDSATTFKKNLNLRVKAAASVSNATVGGKSAETVVKGGIQLIVDSGIALEGDIAGLRGVTAEKGVWQLVDKSGNADSLSFTEKAGTFEVATGFVAIATNKEGETVRSENGILKLSAGKYELSLEEYVANTGDKLTVNVATELDLSQVKPADKEGKLFIGWKNTRTGKPAEKIDSYNKGDVLEAQYIDFAESDFCMEEAQVRADGITGLRYIFTQNKEVTNKLPEIIEYGSIILPTDLANGRELFIDTPIVHEWKWDADTLSNFLPSTTGETPTKVVAENILEESDKALKYTLCLTDISETKQVDFYGVRGYIKFKDSNGIERVIYTKHEQSSLYKAAAETVEAEKTEVHKEIIEYAENDNVELYWQMYPITSYVSGTEECDDKDPKHLLYKQAGLTVADVTLNSGFKGIEETEICFVTDPHFNYMNEEDVIEGNSNVLASYRGRTWLRDGSSGTITSSIMKFASNFKKTVMGGDAVDYLSKGAIEMTRRLIGDKSVNGSVKMVLGNHETMEYCQADAEVSNKYSLEERIGMIQEDWTNNAVYDSEIMKSSKGKDNVMLIYLENGTANYWESQIEPLKKDLATAREKQIPVLIFQHIPMLTMNPNEKVVYENNPYGGGSYGTAEVHTGKFDMTSSAGFLGDPSDSAASLEVCKIIRQNSDVVKGVFNGHIHAWLQTEIVGIDENGKPNGTYIPQYTAYGAHYGGVMKITVK